MQSKVPAKNTSPVKNYVIPLTDILKNDKSALITFSDELKKRGYVFVKLSPELIEQVDTCMKLAETFFKAPLPNKKVFKKEPIFGYFAVNHKESFRFLTGTRIKEQKMPGYFEDIKTLIYTMDQIMFTLSILCSPYLFPNLTDKAKELDIPLFNVGSGWGMFDIAKYHNDGTREALNCKEHFDPGLLSISLRSSEPGLQLKDEFGRWIKVPENNSIAVIWAGDAATKINPKIKHGIHRVVNPITNINKPRISMWHEICTASQEHTELMTKKNTKAVDFESSTGIPMSKSLASPSQLPVTKPKEYIAPGSFYRADGHMSLSKFK